MEPLRPGEVDPAPRLDPARSADPPRGRLVANPPGAYVSHPTAATATVARAPLITIIPRAGGNADSSPRVTEPPIAVTARATPKALPIR